MTLSRLDHVTVACADLDASRAFYEKTLGLKEGPRPAFTFPGAWFYLEDRPVVHLVSAAGAERPVRTGAFDHLAFEAHGIDAVVARVKAQGHPYEVADVPGARIRQVFLHDPDGVKIELNFRD